MTYRNSKLICFFVVLYLNLISFLYATNIKVNHKVKVVIGGAGPAGLLTAYSLLSRKNQQYEVEIYESNPDPRTISSLSFRSYCLGLNIRGQYAINYFIKQNRMKNLWNTIKQSGIQSDSFFLHIGKLKLQIRKPSTTNANKKNDDFDNVNNNDNPPPTLLIQRNDLCCAMLNELESEYKDSNRLKIKFNNKLKEVDLNNQSALLANGDSTEYDLLIGADGVQSAVRSALMNKSRSEAASSNSFYSEEVVLPGIFKVMLQDTPVQLESDAVHAMEISKKIANFGLFLIPATNNRTCVLVSAILSNPFNNDTSSSISYDVNDLPIPLQTNVSILDIQNEIALKFPLFGIPNEEAVKQLLQQRPSVVRTVRCNRYHEQNLISDGGVLLLGDAAHSTGGSLGQGANSALLDIVALDQCLDLVDDKDLSKAISLFSDQQVKEGLALWQLLQLPNNKGIINILYQISQLFWGLLSNINILKPNIPKTTQNALSQTLLPFSYIVKQNQFWIDIATKKFLKIEYTPTKFDITKLHEL